MAKRTSRPKANPAAEVVATAVAQDGSVDPTLLTSQVTIGSKAYTLCFDLGSLARAEHELRAAGHDVNLFRALPGLTLENVMVLFAASLRRFHPEIAFADALKLLKLPHVQAVGLAIADAWRRSLADVDEGKPNPTQPGP